MGVHELLSGLLYIGQRHVLYGTCGILYMEAVVSVALVLNCVTFLQSMKQSHRQHWQKDLGLVDFKFLIIQLYTYCQ